MSIRIILIDDHAAIREGLKSVLKNYDIEVVGEASNIEEALQEIKYKTCDLIVLDLNLGSDDGIKNIEKIRKQPSSPPIVIYSMRDNAATIRSCLSAGAAGFVSKGKEVKELAYTIKEIPLDGSKSMTLLTDREEEIFQALTHGNSAFEVAELMGLSVGTVKNHITGIKKKLNIKHLTELQ